MAAHDAEDFRKRVQQKMVEEMQSDFADSPGSQKKDTPQTKSSPFCIQNFLWLAVAAATFYFSDFLQVILFDSRIRNTWFWIGILSLAIHICVLGFVVLYLHLWKKVGSDDWEKKYPKTIPVATFSFVVGAICLSIGVWPVWGLLTPVVLGALFMGVVIILAMIG